MSSLSASSLASCFPTTFPERLYIAICHTSDATLEWSDNGRAFCIHSIPAVESIVLPRFFPTTKRFASFVRKLNRWGFGRVKDQRPFFDDRQRVYQHPCFQRDHPELLSDIEYIERQGDYTPRNSPSRMRTEEVSNLSFALRSYGTASEREPLLHRGAQSVVSFLEHDTAQRAQIPHRHLSSPLVPFPRLSYTMGMPSLTQGLLAPSGASWMDRSLFDSTVVTESLNPGLPGLFLANQSLTSPGAALLGRRHWYQTLPYSTFPSGSFPDASSPLVQAASSALFHGSDTISFSRAFPRLNVDPLGLSDTRVQGRYLPNTTVRFTSEASLLQILSTTAPIPGSTSLSGGNDRLPRSLLGEGRGVAAGLRARDRLEAMPILMVVPSSQEERQSLWQYYMSRDHT